MKSQLTISDYEWHRKEKRTRRERFLSEMEGAVPWGELERLVLDGLLGRLRAHSGGFLAASAIFGLS